MEFSMQQVQDGTRSDLTELDQALWGELIRQRCGLAFSESRLGILRHALDKRVKRRGLKSYNDYYHYVLFHKWGELEWQNLLELLVNRETSFFRHLPSFTALTSYVLPRLLTGKTKSGVSLFNGWSAGCSNGQEAFSLAMALLDAAQAPHWHVRVSGTDISVQALKRARRARYQLFETRQIPEPFRSKYLRMARDGRHIWHQVAEDVQAAVQFTPFNFMDAESYGVVAYDVIFCQNVLIYFHPDDRPAVVRRLSERLLPGGYLFLGPAEMPEMDLPELEPVHLPDAVLYRRTNGS
jgi:type IV pilus assembly protein PilK